ncbi:MAG: SET domain-containing protein-lysine N-methyltransferase [Pseudomonadota bacterium]
MTDIYPPEFRVDPDLPTADQFAVTSVNGKVGMGVKAKLRFQRGQRVAKFTGQLSNKILQHTLQVSPDTHLHDPWFVGLLTHSCAPNCVLDMQRLEIWALADIEAGELLTIDYAVTEDTLHRQFACGCGSSACRKWITGRREGPNEMGRAYLDGLAARKVKRMMTRQAKRSAAQ